jgi:carboxyl-terminal processing protease
LYDGPLVVLDNRLTASASEIFAAAMQDYRRAIVVVDTTTFGKGTVQAVIDLNHVIDRSGDGPDIAGALKVTVEKMYRITGDSLQLNGVTAVVKIPSLTETGSSTEINMDHCLARDEIKPVSFNVVENGKALFSDELRRRSAERIKRNPLFQDLLAEIALTAKNNDRVSLNEKVRKNDMAQLTRIRDRMDRDRSKSWAQDRNRYYDLTLSYSARASEPGSSDTGEQSSDALGENEAITKETLNILSDLITLNKARQVAGNLSQIYAAPVNTSGRTDSAIRPE